MEYNRIESSISRDDSKSVNEAYASLKSATALTSYAMDEIYKSWSFTDVSVTWFDRNGWSDIYDEYIEIYYPKYMSREYETVSTAFEKRFNKPYTRESFSNMSYSMAKGRELIVQILEDELVYAKIGEEMEKARTAIKEVNRDNSCYEILTDFYTVARFFQKFAETPTGGLQALDETTKAYEKNIETYEIELELYVDEY